MKLLFFSLKVLRVTKNDGSHFPKTSKCLRIVGKKGHAVTEGKKFSYKRQKINNQGLRLKKI